MKLKDSLVNAWWRLRKWADGVDWLGIARNIVGWIGRVLHGILFGWLLPKRYRGLKKQQIFEIIFKSDTPAGKKFDVWLLVLIVLNIVLLVVDSLTGTTTTMTSGAHMSVQFFVFKVLEWGFTILFTFVDFISIFPAYLSLLFPATQALTVLRLLRVMRIFRIFHLSRFQNEVFHLLAALRASAIKIMVFMLFVLVAAVILGTLMFSFESEVNPAFENILSGVYWAVVTITTVGYGDIAPVTVGGRFLAVLVMLLGYSIIAVPTGIVAGEVYAESKKPDRKQRLTAAQRDYDDETEAINN